MQRNLQPHNSFILAKSAAFATGVCLFSFGAASIYYTAKSSRLQQQQQSRDHKHPPRWLYDTLSQIPGGRSVYETIYRIYNNQAFATAGSIIAINVAVFLAWRCAPHSRILNNFFLHSSSGRVSPMLLSTFSHSGGFHLACNMYVLWSFSEIVQRFFGPENFVAFYVSAGVISSFVSLLIKLRTGTMIPSLGASGAIIGLMAFIGFAMPELQVGIPFLPMSFDIKDAIWFLVIIDVAGLIFRWQVFDHAAHLGGVLAGYLLAEHPEVRKQINLYQRWCANTWVDITE